MSHNPRPATYLLKRDIKHHNILSDCVCNMWWRED